MPVPHAVTNSGIIISEYTDTSNSPSKAIPVRKGFITVPKLKSDKNEEESPKIQSTE